MRRGVFVWRRARRGNPEWIASRAPCGRVPTAGGCSRRPTRSATCAGPRSRACRAVVHPRLRRRWPRAEHTLRPGPPAGGGYPAPPMGGMRGGAAPPPMVPGFGGGGGQQWASARHSLLRRAPPRAAVRSRAAARRRRTSRCLRGRAQHRQPWTRRPRPACRAEWAAGMGGMGAPGMGAPGMGAPGMGAPGMGAPGMGGPGMAPQMGGMGGMPGMGPAPGGMGAPGMGAPGHASDGAGHGNVAAWQQPPAPPAFGLRRLRRASADGACRAALRRLRPHKRQAWLRVAAASPRRRWSRLRRW